MEYLFFYTIIKRQTNFPSAIQSPGKGSNSIAHLRVYEAENWDFFKTAGVKMQLRD